MIRFGWLFVLLAVCAGARADERILEFSSDIEIAADSTMTVTETIRVRAEGNRIRRGIYRDFPTDYRDRSGNRINVLFEPIDVMRDGNREAWHSERRSNGIRVYFGSAEATLNPGEYTYRFRYRTARQLGYFENHDELYWNVTGNGWEFFIDQVRASVSLPGEIAADSIRVEGYTGVQGSREQNYTADVDSRARARIETRRALGPQQGLTLVVAFPKGIVSAPDVRARLQWFAQDNRREAVLVVGLIVLVGFLYAQWRRVGRDPASGVIIPEYDPPAGLSPAAMRYIRRMAYDDRCFAADIVELGVRGALAIEQRGKKYVLRKTGDADTTIPQSVRELHAALLSGRSELLMSDAQHLLIGAARRGHEKTLQDTYAEANFRRNDGIGCLGILIGFATMAVAVMIDPMAVDGGTVFVMVLAGILSMVCAGSIYSFLAARRERTPVLGWAIAVLVTALLGMAAALALAVWTSVLFAALVTMIGAVQAPFGFWMRAPTVAGRRLLDRIEGLRLYLGVAERQDLARAQAPPMTVDEYQRLLPYALALEVEQTWGDRLAAAIGPAAVAAAAGGIAWYHAGSGQSFDAGSFGSSLGSSLSSAISSSSSPPGSSSGGSSGGGGGSSGGGGGGGGGGGW